MKKTILYIAIISICLSIGDTSLAQSGQPLYTFPLGVEAYTFRNSFPKDVAKTLDTIKAMGFTEMEGGSNKIAPEEFKKMCDARGISIPATGADYNQLVKAPDTIAHDCKIAWRNLRNVCVDTS